MEPLNTNSSCEIVAADPELYKSCSTVVEIQGRNIDSIKKNALIAAEVGKGLSRAGKLAADSNASDNVMTVGMDDNQARALSGSSYRLAQDELREANRVARSGTAPASYVFSPGVLYYNYWQARANFNVAECVTGEKPDDSLETNSTLNTDRNPCATLIELDETVPSESQMIQYVPLTVTTAEKQTNPYQSPQTTSPILSKSSLYLQATTGRTTFRELGNNDVADMEPFPTETMELGLQSQVKDGDMFWHIPWGGPVAGLFYSHTADGDFVAGSERFLLGAAIGYKQPLYHFDLGPVSLSPYITPVFLTGYSNAKLNYGQTNIPDPEKGIVAGARLQGGVEVSKGDWGSASVYGTYQWDQVVVGGPGHSGEGAGVGVALTLKF